MKTEERQGGQELWPRLVVFLILRGNSDNQISNVALRSKNNWRASEASEPLSYHVN